ncbi:PHO8 [Candida oxycetoniae]|uniref:Alkaline phosphatase n=1 Tax=Candida oxycetoniae TaxID=497107 RepID=A0AAI9T1G0_9ASCO|nr:PHO8 [Candida oxycetoniae]KAI3407138.1 PHO8 [Candida oxycetoniae]
MGERLPLLGGDTLTCKNKKSSSRLTRNLSFMLNVVTLITIAYLYFYSNNAREQREPGLLEFDPYRKKNVIMMVTDGMGPASMSAARSFRQYRDQLAINDILTLEKYFVGTSRTRSSNSLVTDSAAGATAFSCALKSYNGAIGVSPDKSPCGTILEALKLQGYYTGLVVTTRITDATPAAFSSHADYRFQEDLIAQHQIGEYPFGRAVDLILGGGRCHFLPKSVSGGCRADSRNLIEETAKNGWSHVTNREEFDRLDGGKNVSLPLLGLLAETDIPYDIDRDSAEYPSLAEQVKVALTALSEATKDSDQGFFLLIEGSRIDHAGHHNDPAAQVREVLAYDKAFQEVINFIDNTDVETVAISTSDHETGGLVTARQVTEAYPDYLWYPEVLLNTTKSGEYLARKIHQQKLKSSGDNVLRKFIKEEILQSDMGIFSYTDEDVAQLVEKASNPEALLYAINNITSFKAQIGWTTHGHSAVDVNIYAHTNSKSILDRLSSKKFGLFGNHENIEIGAFMETITGSDLTKITKMIKETTHAPSANEVFVVDELHANVVKDMPLGST